MTPRHEIEVSGTKGSVTLEAIVDTGFDGEICLPLEEAFALGLELIGKSVCQFADGSIKRELLFRGTARFLEKKKTVSIYLADGVALIGTRLMKDCRLIDFPRKEIRLSRSSKKA